MKLIRLLHCMALAGALCFSLSLADSIRAANPPNAGLKMWLKADIGVSTNADGTISAWADQASGGGLPHDGTPVGSPTLGKYQFVNGPHPVVQFDGFTQGFTLLNDADLRLTNLTIYAVASIGVPSYSRVFVSNYQPGSGWALGISDGQQNYVKFYTANPDNSMEPGGESILTPDNTPYLLTASYAGTDGAKQLFVSTNLVGSETGVVLVYGPETQANVGQLTDGGGQRVNGNIAEILIYSEVSESQNAEVWAYLNEKYFGLGSGPVTIAHQPESQTVNEGEPVTFDVAFNGAPPVSIQWYENLGGTNSFQPIQDATNVYYTISNVTRAEQGSIFQARLSNLEPSNVTSSNATLTVILHTNAPTIVSASRGYLDSTKVTVTYDKAVSSATATDTNNYSIDNGLAVLAAANGVTASNVVLTFDGDIGLQSVPILTVNNVADLSGNQIASNSEVTVSTPLSSTLPPVNSQLVLWLAADKGVLTEADGHSATNWTDLSGAPSEHSGSLYMGQPQLALANFNSGPNYVVRLDGQSGFILDNSDDFDLDELSIYIVGSVYNGVASSEFIANWAGFAFGISDSIPGRVKWVSFDGSAVDSMEPVGASLGDKVPTQLTGTFSSMSGTKTLYVNGEVVGVTTNLTVQYTSSFTTVGMLSFSGAQFLKGDIAEILVFSDVNDTERGEVENYLYQKYFASPNPRIAVEKSGSNLILTWPGDGTLQSTDGLNGPWSDVIGATSGFIMAPTNNQEFFRLQVP